MLDQDRIDYLHDALSDRFTAEELCEILHLSVNDIFVAFLDDVLKIDWSELL